MEIKDIKPYEKNAKKHPKKQIEQVANSIKEFGFNQPVVVDKNGVLIVGHGRLEAAKLLGLKEIPTITVDLTEEQANAYRLADNKLNESDWDMTLVIEELKGLTPEMFDLTGFDKDLLIEDPYGGTGNVGSIAEDFLFPPFSVLDTMSAKWLERKRGWLALGIESEVGRKDNLLGESLGELGEDMFSSSTSVFDPVLCELMYKWFNTPNGTVLDPFCGGSVRGIIASKNAMQYTGIDLREEQVLENRKQSTLICEENIPVYFNGDSNEVLDTITEKYDFVFSCPPYVDLEVYSNDKADISNMEYDDFKTVYKNIIEKACNKLKDDRFAVFVVSEVRDKKGIFYNFVGDTITAFTDSGMSYYNEIILKNSVGTLPLRIRKTFNNRKIGRMHQNVLVFYKGNPKNIQKSYPQDMEFEELQ